MSWVAFLGALVGIVIGALAVTGILTAWGYLDEHRAKKQPITTDGILESDLAKYIVDCLFWAMTSGDWKNSILKNDGMQ